MWLEGPTVQTRLICILRGLEVNMHEGIKRYAFKQTTRSLWITVPTSEPFIFLLACNQADLVCSGWWFHTMDWTLRDVNLLRKKTLSSNQKEHSKKKVYVYNSTKICTRISTRRCFLCIFFRLDLLNCKTKQPRTEKHNRMRVNIWKYCSVLDTELWWPIKYWRNVCWNHEFIFQTDFL